MPFAGQSKLGRIELHAREAQDAVRPTLEPRLDARQAARKTGEEAVIEATDPGLAGSDDARALAARPRHDGKFRLNVDNSQSVDEVAGQTAGNDDLEAAAYEVDQQTELGVELRAAQLQPFTPHELRSDRQHAVEPRVGEDGPGDIANAGDCARGQAKRHSQRPWRQPAAAVRFHVDEAGLVELHERCGQPVGIARGAVGAVQRPQHADVAARHVRKERWRAQQVEAEGEISIGAFAEVDRAAGDGAERHGADG